MPQRCAIVLSTLLMAVYRNRSAQAADLDDQVLHNLHAEIDDGSLLMTLIVKWAPLVWLAPGETFLPSSTTDFLKHVTPWSPKWLNRRTAISSQTLPIGPGSQLWFLITKKHVDNLLQNKSSILYGHRPDRGDDSVPVYAQITRCQKPLHFYVTYWLFFPYSQGKEVCILNLGLIGPWPIPMVDGRCFGAMQEFGSHVGDWEHMTLYFNGNDFPAEMYVSAHDAGAFYIYEQTSKKFLFQRQEVRKGILQRPTFPPIVYLTAGNHPVLFAAKGSHGLWAAPGKHKYVRVPRLYDESGFGIPWATWRAVSLLKGSSDVDWLGFQGRWGNPRANCHPLANTICRLVDGPTGIPMKKHHFSCHQNNTKKIL